MNTIRSYKMLQVLSHSCWSYVHQLTVAIERGPHIVLLPGGIFAGRIKGLAQNGLVNVLRGLISLRRHSVLLPWYICAFVCPNTNF